jgi:hypothetical protein
MRSGRKAGPVLRMTLPAPRTPRRMPYEPPVTAPLPSRPRRPYVRPSLPPALPPLPLPPPGREPAESRPRAAVPAFPAVGGTARLVSAESAFGLFDLTPADLEELVAEGRLAHYEMAGRPRYRLEELSCLVVEVPPRAAA